PLRIVFRTSFDVLCHGFTVGVAPSGHPVVLGGLPHGAAPTAQGLLLKTSPAQAFAGYHRASIREQQPGYGRWREERDWLSRRSMQANVAGFLDASSPDDGPSNRCASACGRARA